MTDEERNLRRWENVIRHVERALAHLPPKDTLDKLRPRGKFGTTRAYVRLRMRKFAKQFREAVEGVRT